MLAGRVRDLPSSVQDAYIHASGLRLRRADTTLALSIRAVLLSPSVNKVSTRNW